MKSIPRLTFACLAGLLCSLVLTVTSFGFGNQGHELVAVVAWNQLDAATRSEVSKIVAQNPEIFGTRTGIQALKHAAKWPDAIRTLARKDEDDPDYIDTPLAIFESIDVQSASDADNFHYDNRNGAGKLIDNKKVRASYAISRCVEVLRDPASTPRMRGEALAYLVHCVGDIHQPLHAGYLKDQGGNTIKGLKIPGVSGTFSLHSVWDGGIIRTTGVTEVNAYYTTRLAPRVSAIGTAALADLNPNAWSEDSYTLALANAYKNEAGRLIKANETLSDAYVQRGIALIDDQIARAGVRLGALLTQALAPAGNHALGAAISAGASAEISEAVPATWSLHIAILDVGQADAIVMVTPDGSACVIDSGKTSTSGKAVAHFLRTRDENNVRDIGTVQLAFATHYDSDHIGGFEAISDEGIIFNEVNDQGISVKRHGKDVYNGYLRAVGDEQDRGDQGVRHKAEPGQEWTLGRAKIKCVSVRGDTIGTANDLSGLDPASGEIDENPGSIALLVTVGEFEFYTAGDQTSGDWKGEPDTETGVVKSKALGPNSDIDVLKVSHHGSDTSSGHDFIRTLKPEVAVISSKFTGGDRLPKMVAVKQLVEAGAQVLVTGNGHNPESDTFTDSKHGDDDGYTPPEGSVTNAAGTVHIFVSTDGSTYMVKGNGYNPTRFSAIDGRN